MSSPVQFVIREGGTVIFRRMSGGGEADAERWVLIPPLPTIEEFDDWGQDRFHPGPDAAFLIDHDERRLLVEFSHSYAYDDWDSYRRVYLRVLQHMWPDWRTGWAYAGTEEMLHHLGLEPAEVCPPYVPPPPTRRVHRRPPRHLRRRRPKNKHPEPEVEKTYVARNELDTGLLTVDDGTEVRAYALRRRLPERLASGEEILARLPEEALCGSRKAMPVDGMHLDLPARTGGYWTTLSSLPVHHDDRFPRWPGWSWEFWEDDHHRQLDLARGAVTLPEPDLDTTLLDFAERHRQWRLEPDYVRDLLLEQITGCTEDEKYDALAALIAAMYG
ncbi:hypothetical protein [Actinomadura macrotermitis]|uniref:Uncharacterized protein n=1 Tax=Actinomadura macrotermitis TaxID=2585200 RepID=A0A7K0C1X2_9ACTN|nr:hypothetical protein [Actinomadura macrotermitis]MQY07356.1 hypothetical protein [Actinomadura macrotermitis]